jgi:hypothetical protein
LSAALPEPCPPYIYVLLLGYCSKAAGARYDGHGTLEGPPFVDVAVAEGDRPHIAERPAEKRRI